MYFYKIIRPRNRHKIDFVMKINDITIKVHRFGPLEKVSFKLAPMMIFTGKSSLGKSYANYLVYYLMSSICNGRLREVMRDEKAIGDEWKGFTFDMDEFFKELNENVQGFMRKFLGDDELKCDVEFKSPKRIRTFSVEVKKLEMEGSQEKEGGKSLLHAPQSYSIRFNGGKEMFVPNFSYARFYAERSIQEFVLGEYVARAIILPPGRGAFAGENFSMKSEVGSSMNMYNYFFHDYDNGINSRIRFRDEDKHHLSARLLNMTSGGELFSVEGKQYIQLNEKQRIALSAGASSVKDLSPWIFYLKNYNVLSCSFCMEEPEAHQHPSVTVQIADVMAVAMHQRNGNLFHLTTHSDYLIQRLNQLVKLGSIRRKNKSLYHHICEERSLDPLSYLDAKDIQAYYFSKGEKGNTIVEQLEVSDEGIPMKSFFDVIRDLDEREEYINEAIYHIEKEWL